MGSLWDILDRPIVWNMSRIGLDLAFGLYRKRERIMRDSGFLDGNPSILDIGCGIGQFSALTTGRYLGIDMNRRYIDYAQSRPRRDNVSFRCGDVTELVDEGEMFDIVLLVDILHHIPDEPVVKLLNTASKLARRCVINFEPITEQTNALGTWLIENDRGDYIRPLNELFGLYARPEANVSILRSQPIKAGPLTGRTLFSRGANT